MLLKELLSIFIHELKGIYEAREAENIARIAFEHVLLIEPNRLKYLGDQEVLPQKVNELNQIIKRLQSQEPIQYIIHEAWFYDVPFYVNPNVLIPRPETEELVYWIIKDYMNANKPPQILDIGCGSGCIAVTLKRKLPKAQITGCDISKAALSVTKINAEKYKCSLQLLQLNFLNEASWNDLPDAAIIVSNPPYIPVSEKKQLALHVTAHEPELALFVPDDDPLIFYKKIAAFGKQKLRKSGAIYIEIHEAFGNEVVRLFKEQGYEIELRKDLQQKERMAKATVKN